MVIQPRQTRSQKSPAIPNFRNWDTARLPDEQIQERKIREQHREQERKRARFRQGFTVLAILTLAILALVAFVASKLGPTFSGL